MSRLPSSLHSGFARSKMPDEINSPGILFWRRPTLARPIAVLPSGLQRFTAVFGMGTGGATALLLPECGTALAVSLLPQRRKHEADSLGTASALQFLSAVSDRGYNIFERT